MSDMRTRSLGVRWADVVAFVLAYGNNNLTEEHLAAAVREKLNAVEKPVTGWAEADLAQAVRDKLNMGGGVGECSTAAATAAKAATISGFKLVDSVIVSILFDNDVPAGATLNINDGTSNTGAKPIYVGNAAIAAGIIAGGTLVTFRYAASGASGGCYVVTGMDKPYIADESITAAKLALGVVPGVRYYASLEAYTTDAANVPAGEYVFITDSGTLSLYQRTSDSRRLICTFGATSGGNTTLPQLGGGFGVCSTAGATAAKKANIDGFTITGGGIVSIKFTNAVPANATLAISADGGTTYPTARAIHFRGSAITAGVIPAGAVATFRYDNTVATPVFRLIGIDASGGGYGTCSTAAATASKTVSISNFSLAAGASVAVKFTYDVPANATLNVNSAGAKNIKHKGANVLAGIIHAGDTATFYYDGSYFHLVGIDRLSDNPGNGFGIASSTTAGGTVPKTATLANFNLTAGGFVAVKFTTPVEASATLNINSSGAKSIYFKGAAIPAGIIGYGDTALFVYDGSVYHLLGVDKAMRLRVTITAGVNSMSASCLFADIMAAYTAGLALELLTELGTVLQLKTIDGSSGAEFDGVTYAGPGEFYLSSYFIDVDEEITAEHVLANGPPEFAITITKNNNTYSANKTFAQISSAYSGGYELVLQTEYGTRFSLTNTGKNGNNQITAFYFCGLDYDGTEGFIRTYTINSSGVSVWSGNISKFLGTKSLFMTQTTQTVNGEDVTTYTYQSSTVTFANLDELISLIQAGLPIQLVNYTTGDIYQLAKVSGAASTARVTFSGMWIDYATEDLNIKSFTFDGSMNITEREIGVWVPNPEGY